MLTCAHTDPQSQENRLVAFFRCSNWLIPIAPKRIQHKNATASKDETEISCSSLTGLLLFKRCGCVCQQLSCLPASSPTPWSFQFCPRAFPAVNWISFILRQSQQKGVSNLQAQPGQSLSERKPCLPLPYKSSTQPPSSEELSEQLRLAPTLLPGGGTIIAH